MLLAHLIEGINGIGQEVHKHLVELSWEAVNGGNLPIVCDDFDGGTMPIAFQSMASDEHRTFNAILKVKWLFRIGICSGKGTQTLADGLNAIARSCHSPAAVVMRSNGDDG